MHYFAHLDRPSSHNVRSVALSGSRRYMDRDYHGGAQLRVRHIVSERVLECILQRTSSSHRGNSAYCRLPWQERYGLRRYEQRRTL